MVIALLVLRWVHILAAITLMGGALFQRLALLPAAEELPDDAHQQLRELLRPRWAKLVMMTSGLLLMSGMTSYVLTVVGFRLDRTHWAGGLYHMLFGVKFLLALIVFYLAALLSGRSETAKKLRENLRFWLTLNLVLAVLIVVLGGVMRFAPRETKEKPSAMRHKPPAVRLEVTAPVVRRNVV